MKEVKDYYFKPTNRKEDGFIYIKDPDGNLVSIGGKVKKFKSTTGCADFIYKLELARDTMLEESNES